MKRPNSEQLIAGGTLVGMILLFGSFMFGKAVYTLLLILVVGVIAALLLPQLHWSTAALRSLVSLILCAAMVGGIILPAYASDDVPGYAEKGNGRDLLTYLRDELSATVDTYQLTPEMTDEDLANVYFALDYQEAKYAWDYSAQLMEDATGLSPEDAAALNEEENTKLCMRLYDIIKQINTPMSAAYSQSYTVDNLSIAVTGNDDQKYYDSSQDADNSVTATIKTHTSTDSCGETAYNQHTVSVTITNNSGKNAKFSFDWAVTPCDSTHSVAITVDGQTPAGVSDSFSTNGYIANGAGVTITLQSCSSCVNNSSLTVSGFTCEPEADSSEVTFVYDSSLGSITVAGSAVSSGHKEQVTTTGVAVTATANDGKKFLGWVNEETHQRYSTDTSTTLTPGEDATIRAQFVKADTTDGWYLVGGTYLYSDLNQGAEKAASLNDKTVALLNNAILPSGNYTIPSGVTLLIPFDDANTLIKDNPDEYLLDAYADKSSPRSQYRQLKMNSGAKITVQTGGSICVGSKVANQFIGQLGSYGAVYMNEGSNITIQSGGFLYCWGYIFAGSSGNGTVTVESGGTVYEPISIMDYPGSSSLTNSIKKEKVFPMRAYTIRNVEIPMTINSGAKEYVFYGLWGNRIGSHPGEILLIANQKINNMTPGFQLGPNTTLTKSYSNGTQYLTANGDITLNSLSVTIDGGALAGTVDFSTSQTSGFLLPSGYDVTQTTGMFALNDNLIMTEGSKFTIAHGATFNTNGKNLYVLDNDDDVGAVPKVNGCSIYVQDVHGNYYTQVAKDAVLDINGTLSASGGFYTSEHGANITSSKGTGVINVTGTSSATSVKVKDSSNSYQTITINHAQLKNADGVTPTFTDTSNGTGEYFYAHGLWHKKGNSVCATCAEAQIGSTYYWTLAEAINAASAGGTVQLLKDVETAVTVSKPLVIARNAHSANITPESGLFLCTSDAAYAVTKGFTLKSAECSYEAEVVLRMKLYIPDEYLDGNYTICLIKDGRWGDVETSYTMTQLKEDGADKNGLYWAMAGVASGEMTRNVTIDIQDGSGNAVTIFKPNGDPVGTSFAYTVKQYINAVQQSDARTPEEKAAAKALAVYGGYAQQYFKVSTDNLAYEGLELPDLSTVTADTVGHAVTYEGTEAGIRVKSFEPFLDSKTYLRLKFVIEDGSDISNFTFTMTGTDGKSKTLEAFYEAESKRYCVDILDIPAAYLDHTYPVTVTNKTTGKIHTVNASVLSWVNLAIRKSNNEEQVNMAKALYLYNQAANTLFKK